jgi:hypothetical protein
MPEAFPASRTDAARSSPRVSQLVLTVGGVNYTMTTQEFCTEPRPDSNAACFGEIQGADLDGDDDDDDEASMVSVPLEPIDRFAITDRPAHSSSRAVDSRLRVPVDRIHCLHD